MTEPLAQPVPGAVLHGGRYRIERPLGEGSQGETFAAIDARDGARVAIKRFQVRGAKSWKDVELAEREAQVLSSLDHPSIPRYRDHFEEKGALFLVTDFIDGESLAQLRKRGTHFDEAAVVRFLRDASGTLGYLHGRAPPVIHRDIKPGNVIRRPDGSFALIDFGSVRDRMKPEGGSTVVGTFGYMAPEQFQGRAMPCSDVYALGATALSLLTGREPEAMPHKGLGIDVRAATAGMNLRPALVDALASMLDPDPDVRSSAVAPLLARLDAPVQPPQPAPAVASPAAWSTADTANLPRAARRAIARAERVANRTARRLQRHAESAEERRAEFDRGMEKMRRDLSGLEGFARAIAFFALTVALVAVTIALRAVVPTILRVLSLIFGKPLRDAADKVSEAGAQTAEAFRKTLDSFGVHAGPSTAPPDTTAGQPPPVRIDASGPRDEVRVEVEPPARGAEIEAPRAIESRGDTRRRGA